MEKSPQGKWTFTYSREGLPLAAWDSLNLHLLFSGRHPRCVTAVLREMDRVTILVHVIVADSALISLPPDALLCLEAPFFLPLPSLACPCYQCTYLCWSGSGPHVLPSWSSVCKMVACCTLLLSPAQSWVGLGHKRTIPQTFRNLDTDILRRHLIWKDLWLV